ncbi:alanine racemase [Campylobacter pinnipediorum subsp. pinnipediorum]|uniref:alanine racemase n=1 Tax=Campylobacter pinnipediorum TaxID=1965231 RepID=UPI0009953B33|nr:alanine racemase [Campylobacter pinnipediorum]OPA74523.1 alanine racemase [Campylobacter pinnipediorum subsp. pinnipediorum]
MSKIKLDTKAYKNNLNQITKKIGSKDRIILVLKDNAYGHGATALAPLASELGFKFCAVKDEREAFELVDFFEKILVLSHIPNGDENSEFIYAINDIASLRKIKNNTKIHLAIDTLMHRNGILYDELDLAFEIIKDKNIILLGAFTHFRSADILNADYFVQKQNFNKTKERIRNFCISQNFQNPIFHSHNSAGLERVYELDDELVRIGMSQFGYCQFNNSLSLKPVLSLWADKVSDRILKAGSSVGYGAKFTTTKDIKIATYDLGYGDGLLRYNGVGDLFLANKNKILGTMSMDSFSCIDSGDSVCVFDDAAVFAKYFNTIEYDILVKLSPFIQRVLV